LGADLHRHRLAVVATDGAGTRAGLVEGGPAGEVETQLAVGRSGGKGHAGQHRSENRRQQTGAVAGPGHGKAPARVGLRNNSGPANAVPRITAGYRPSGTHRHQSVATPPAVITVMAWV